MGSCSVEKLTEKVDFERNVIKFNDINLQHMMCLRSGCRVVHRNTIKQRVMYNKHLLVHSKQINTVNNISK